MTNTADARVLDELESVRKMDGHREECKVLLVELHDRAVLILGMKWTKRMTTESEVVSSMKVIVALIMVAASATDIRDTM